MMVQLDSFQNLFGFHPFFCHCDRIVEMVLILNESPHGRTKNFTRRVGIHHILEACVHCTASHREKPWLIPIGEHGFAYFQLSHTLHTVHLSEEA